MAGGACMVGACIAGGGVCAGGGGVHSRRACMAGEGGVHGRGHADGGGMCMAGGHACHTCPPGRYYGIQSMSRRYASYWNAFLFYKFYFVEFI